MLFNSIPCHPLSSLVTLSHPLLQTKADIYTSYNKIYRYIVDPFTATAPDALLHNARYLLNVMPKVCLHAWRP